MIEKLTIRNFKSWELCDLEFGKVTALFGANSSGKTSILQFLLMLKQTVESRDRRYMNLGGTSQDYVDLGSYQDVVHGHDVHQSVAFSLNWNTIKETGLFDDYRDAQLSVQYQYLDNEVVVTESILKANVGNDGFRFIADKSMHENGERFYEQISSTTTLTKDKKYTSKIEPFDKKKTQTDVPAILRSFYLSEFQDLQSRSEDSWSILGHNLLTVLETNLEVIQYLGPLRAYPQREYRWTGERPSTVGVRGEFAVHTMLADMIAGSVNDKQPQGQLLASTNTWLKRLGVVEEIELRPVGEKSRLYEVIVKSPNFKHEANLADVGFGVSQVLPIVVMAHLVPEGSLLILEQPELHLHPNVQSLLADFFLELSVERNIQFLIESHSERLMARLQLLTVEKPGKLSALKEDDLRFYHCRRDAEHSVLEPVLSDLDGNLTNVPTEFYDPILPFIAQLEAEEALAGNGSGETIDLSTNHDYHITNPTTHVLRDKTDDQPQ